MADENKSIYKDQKVNITRDVGELIKRQKITLVNNDDFTKQDINTALTSIQTCLDEIINQVNILKQGPGEVEVTVERGPDETLYVNIEGNAKTSDNALNDGDGKNIKATYYKNEYMQFDESTGTLNLQ